MTTQTPSDAATPFPAYPTAPPWAPPESIGAAPPTDERPAGNPLRSQHGGLMVAYPELMNGAGRPKPPSWVPVVLTTVLVGAAGATGVAVVASLLFGPGSGLLAGWGGAFSLALLGAVPAARRAGAARRDGNLRYPYWLAFCLGYAGTALLSVILVSVAVPVYLNFRESAATHAVQSSIVHDGKVNTDDGVTVQKALCTPTGSRGADGQRPYRCAVTLSNGGTGVLRVVADGQGSWTADRTR